MAFFTYSTGSLIDIRYFSRTPSAIALKPVPGNQSGRCRTIQVLLAPCVYG